MLSLSIAVVLLSAVSCQPISLPSFSWEDNPNSPIPLLRITFPDGLEDDFAVLTQYNPIPLGRDEREEDVDSCIYHGYLTNEKKVYVTVTGCANTHNFEVQFKSSRMSDYMFQVKEGKVEKVESVFGSKAADRNGILTTIKDEGIPVPALRSSTQSETERGLNPRGYYLRIKLWYDDNFYEKFGSDAVNAARRVIAQAQNLYMWGSLTTTVTFLVDNNVDYVPGRYAAATDIESVRVYSTNPNYDTNVYLAFRNNEGGTVGIAYVGTVCHPAEYLLRTALCEYMDNDLKSGQIIAHEIGHNLNMNHDFNGAPGQMRRDSRGRQCSGVGGVMDYYGSVNTWSTCSIEDFTKLVNQYGSSFCLKSR